MFCFPRPTIIQHFGWKSMNSPLIFVYFLKFRHFPKIRYKTEIWKNAEKYMLERKSSWFLPDPRGLIAMSKRAWKYANSATVSLHVFLISTFSTKMVQDEPLFRAPGRAPGPGWARLLPAFRKRLCFIACMPDRASRHHFRVMVNGLYDVLFFYGFVKRKWRSSTAEVLV